MHRSFSKMRSGMLLWVALKDVLLLGSLSENFFFDKQLRKFQALHSLHWSGHASNDHNLFNKLKATPFTYK